MGGRNRREEEKGILGNRDDIQKLVNQEARASTGASHHQYGSLPAAAQLNRKRRFAVRLISLPDGDQARELVGAVSTLGGSLELFLGHPDRREETVLLESAEHPDVTTIVEDKAGAKYEAERR